MADASGIASDQDVETDLCVVGAGPAGITIAQELDGSGVRVSLLESGGIGIVPEAQRASRGESIGYPLHKLDLSRVRAFGGTSNAWEEYGGWNARPLDRIDFEARPSITHSGWPFDRAHLDPFYERAHLMCGLGPYSYIPEEWSDESRTPLLKLTAAGAVENTMFQRAVPQTFTHTYSQFIRSRNVKVFLNTRAYELRTATDSRRVTSVLVRRDDGSCFNVRPRHVVLAAGGIENARILLIADGLRGLGNDHDMVGRFFSERLSARTGELVVHAPDLAQHIDFYELHPAKGIQAQGGLRVVDSVQDERALLNCVFFPLKRPGGINSEAVRSAATLVKARKRRPLVRDVFGHLRNVIGGMNDIASYTRGTLGLNSPTIIIRAQQEQAPNPSSRVTLGSGRDDAGQPVAQVEWKMTERDRMAMVESQGLLDEALQASGIGHIDHVIGQERPSILFEGNYHHMGTTRMHVDPRHGVVDASCRVHGVPNVHIAGSSVFPTYGCSNPTLTIIALAIRLADDLRREFAA